MRTLAYDRYNVSVQALAWRLEELKQVPSGFAEDFMTGRKQVPPKFYRRPLKPSWIRKFGEDYVKLAFQAYRTGLISAGRLAHYLRVDVKRALEEAEIIQYP
jgi:Zn-dependent peptidase ImmA (M78 family)